MGNEVERGCEATELALHSATQRSAPTFTAAEGESRNPDDGKNDGRNPQEMYSKSCSEKNQYQQSDQNDCHHVPLFRSMFSHESFTQTPIPANRRAARVSIGATYRRGAGVTRRVIQVTSREARLPIVSDERDAVIRPASLLYGPTQVCVAWSSIALTQLLSPLSGPECLRVRQPERSENVQSAYWRCSVQIGISVG